MSEVFHALLFRLLANRTEDQIDLGEAALLVAAEDQPELDVSRYVRELDRLGAATRARLGRTPPALGILDFLFKEIGFRGNSEDYYDPRNSFLNAVIDRKIGIPITLAVVLIEVGRRAGVPMQGVSFPGHFLVRAAGARGPVFLDPFEGRALSRDELGRLAERTTGRSGELDARWLDPASKKQILFRMLANLRAIYAARADRERLRSVLERMEMLSPSDELRRELEQAGGGRAWTSRGPHAVN